MNRLVPLPPDDDPTIARTIETLRRLYDEERQQPDDLFVRRLERTLMTGTPTATMPPHGALDRLTDGIRHRLPERRSPLAWLNPAASIAIVAAIIAATLFLALRGADPDPDRPATFGAFTTGTPDSEPEQLPEQAPGVLWQLPLPAGESLDWGGMEIRDGVIYRLLATPSFVGIEAVSTLHGNVLWKQSMNWSQGGIVPETRAANQALAADGSRIYLFSRPNQISAIDARSGERLWSADLPAAGISIATGLGWVFVWDENATLLKLGPTDGSIQWTAPAESDIDGYRVIGPFVSDTGVVLTSGPGGVISAIDVETGEANWVLESGLDPLNTSIIESTLDDGSPIVVLQGFRADARSDQPTRDYLIFTIDPMNGEVLWRASTAASVISNVLVDRGRVFVVANGSQEIATPVEGDPDRDAPTNALHAYDLATGEPLWTRGSETSFYYALRKSANRAIIALRNDGHLVAIDPETGAQLCTPFELPGGQMPITALVDGAIVYATLLDGTLIAIDLFDDAVCP